jgi:toxin FitB
VLGWSDGLPRAEMCIASVVEAELRAGVERLPDGRRKHEAGRALEGFLRAAFEGRVFPFDRAAAPIHAGLVAARRRAGRPVSVPDALIAATARAHGAALLATRDTSGFEGCGVPLVNPWNGPQAPARTVFRKVPMPSISHSITSPSLSVRGGCMA